MTCAGLAAAMALAAILGASPQTDAKSAEDKAQAAQAVQTNAPAEADAAARQKSALEHLGNDLGLHSHAHHHGGHDGQAPAPSPEDAARQKELNSLTEKKLTALAAFLEALVAGESDAQAIQKAGIPVTDLDRLSFLSERYYPARASALDIEANLKALQGAPKPTDPGEAKKQEKTIRSLTWKLAAHERFREQFFQQITPENRALVDKFEPTFVSLVRKQTEAKERQKAEARAAAKKDYGDKSIPGLIAYLTAKGQMKPEAVAVAESGLTPQVLLGLSDLAIEYASHKLAAEHSAAEIPKAEARRQEKAKAHQSTAFEVRLIREFQKNVDDFAAWQKKFAEENGEALQRGLEANFEALSKAYRSHEEVKAKAAQQ